MQTIFKLFTYRQIKLTILISILFILILSVTSYAIYFYSINHYENIADKLFQITKYYLQIEQKRAASFTKKLRQKHLELANILKYNTLLDVDSFLNYAKEDVESIFGSKVNIAVINSNLIIKNSTFEMEKGLDLKNFEDAVKVAKKLRDTKDFSYVDITFPVYTPASNTFKIYTFSYIPEIDYFLQIGIDLDYFNVDHYLTNYDNDIRFSLLYFGGGDHIDTFDISDGKQVILDKKLEDFLISGKIKFVADSFIYKNIYHKILKFDYSDKISGNIILKLSIAKKSIYKVILVLLLFEILIFILLFFSIRDTSKFYKNHFFRPFREILTTIRRGELIEQNHPYKVKELYILSRNYNKILTELLSKQNELEKAINEIRTLRELLPICTSCKKIRTENNSWETIETYLSKSHNLDFTHSLCPECIRKLYPEIADKILNKEL